MSEMSPEQQKALEEQKKQCIFCKIIAGEMNAKKVFEDDTIIAILDINPLSKGHILVMPKEHYPIMPLLPPEVFKHMFQTTKDLCLSLKKAILRTGTNVFIANGYVAGQVSPHFMFHIIPRENQDNIENFNTKGTIEQDLESELSKALKNNMPIMMANHFKRNPEKWHSTAPVKKQEYNQEQVVELIKQNPQIEKIIKENPEEFLKQLPHNEQLKEIFKNVDINKIISTFNPEFQPKEVIDLENPKIDVYQMIEKSPKLKDLILTDSDKFKETIRNVPELKEIFKDKNIDEIIKNTKENETSSKEKSIVPPITEDIYTLINKNPKLKSLILNNPDKFKNQVNTISQLKELFKDHELDEIIKVCKKEEELANSKNNESKNDEMDQDNHDDTKNHDKEDKNKSDLDKISGLFQ